MWIICWDRKRNQSVSKASSAVQVCACSERPWVAGFSLLCEHMQQICGLSCFPPSLAHAKITVKPILHTKLLKGSSWTDPIYGFEF